MLPATAHFPKLQRDRRTSIAFSLSSHVALLLLYYSASSPVLISSPLSVWLYRSCPLLACFPFALPNSFEKAAETGHFNETSTRWRAKNFLPDGMPACVAELSCCDSETLCLAFHFACCLAPYNVAAGFVLLQAAAGNLTYVLEKHRWWYARDIPDGHFPFSLCFLLRP